MNTTNTINQARARHNAILVILALIATFSLIGCGGSSASADKDAAPPKEEKKSPPKEEKKSPPKPTPPPAPATPSEADARKVYENEQHDDQNFAVINADIAKVRSFKKTNGQMREQSGRKVYAFDYEVELECLREFDNRMPGSSKGIDCSPGKTIKRSGAIQFEQTERGWKGEDGKVYGK